MISLSALDLTCLSPSHQKTKGLLGLAPMTSQSTSYVRPTDMKMPPLLPEITIFTDTGWTADEKRLSRRFTFSTFDASFLTRTTRTLLPGVCPLKVLKVEATLVRKKGTFGKQNFFFCLLALLNKLGDFLFFVFPPCFFSLRTPKCIEMELCTCSVYMGNKVHIQCTEQYKHLQGDQNSFHCQILRFL